MASSRKSWPLYRFLDNLFMNRFIVPTRRLIVLVFTGALLTGIGFALEVGLYVFITYNALLIILSIIDWVLLPTSHQFQFERKLPEQVDVQETFTAHIHVAYRGYTPIQLQVIDDFPESFSPKPTVQQSVVHGKQNFSYETQPGRRGLFTYHYVYVRLWGGLQLLQKQYRYHVPQQIKVLPNLATVRGYLSSMQHHLVLDGKRINRKPRAGTEFYHVREYVPDDDLRLINWGASARSRTMMTNVYQPERGKTLTLLIDCGRMMGVEINRRQKLDESLETALTMAAVALKLGDQVALLAFSGQVQKYVAPDRGMSHFHKLLEAVYDLQSDTAEANYGLAFSYLSQKQSKRSFVVLFSDMENYLFEDQLQTYLSRLRHKHALLLLSLQDPLLWQWQQSEVKDTRSAYIKNLASKWSVERKLYKQNMAQMGIQVIDVAPDDFALTAVNLYLDRKSKEAL